VRRLLLIMIPAALFAQVEVDTVVRLPGRLMQGYFVPELNRLYAVTSDDTFLNVLDCSTYSLRAQIHLGMHQRGGRTHYSWSSLRRKLYVVSNPNIDSTLVIDAMAESVVDTLGVPREWYNDVYLSDLDVRFKPSVDTLYEYECATDSVVRRLPIHCTCASWDSVGRKLYIGQGSYKKLYVYDYLADSCLKVIDVSAVTASYPDACIFSRTHRRAYVSSFQFEPLGSDKVGIVDTDRDTLLRVLSVRVTNGLYNQAAVDERDGKVYIVDCSGSYYYPDTMWVVDCATDSVIKKFECAPFGADAGTCIRWVPWSNRIYLINDFGSDVGGSLVVIDCNTDSVIVPSMLRGGLLRDIQIDPIRQRIFVIGDTNKVYVLRDVEGGVAEEPTSVTPASGPGLQVQPTSGGFDLSYSIASPCRVDLSVYNLTGREVRRLVAERQSAGERRVLWNCEDSVGNPVPSGVYLIRLDTPDFTDARKAVVTR